MKKSFLLLLLSITLLFAQNITVAFMGIILGGAPEFEKRFDVILREQIAVIPGIDIADYDDTEYLKKKTNFYDSPVITRSFIESLIKISDDRTLVVWGEINNFTIKPARRWLIGAEAVGSMKLSFTMYSLGFHEYAYLGDIECKTSIPKPPVFFRNVDKVTHITASERAVIIEELKKQAAGKSADIISGVIRSQLIKTGVLSPDAVKAKKVPSVSDLFDIPTVEAPDVDESAEDKKKEQPKSKEIEPKTEEKEVPEEEPVKEE